MDDVEGTSMNKRMNNKIVTVRLSPSQIEGLKAYGKECSITFSAALREYIVIASRELKDRKEDEKISSELEKLKSNLMDLGKSIEDLKLLYSTPANSDGVH